MLEPDKQIIELHPEKPDEGEIRYTYNANPAKSRPSQNLLAKIFGIILGVGFFILLIFFFVYVILPVIAIVLIYMLLRRLLKN